MFDAETAERRNEIGEAVILVRVETSPEDIHGMHAAKGILTARGGMTSHAAVVAREKGISYEELDEAVMKTAGEFFGWK